jgi:hypothetical protein
MAEGRGVEQGFKSIQPPAGVAGLVVEQVTVITHAVD